MSFPPFEPEAAQPQPQVSVVFLGSGLMLMRGQNLAPFYTVIPVEVVCRDYFRHLTSEKFIRKTLSGEISIPIVRMEGSQRTARGVHINDLAVYLDKQADAARKECEQLKQTG